MSVVEKSIGIFTPDNEPEVEYDAHVIRSEKEVGEGIPLIDIFESRGLGVGDTLRYTIRRGTDPNPDEILIDLIITKTREDKFRESIYRHKRYKNYI